MPSIYALEAPDKQQIRLRVLDAGVDLTRWTSYSFASNFLTPADGWSVTIGDSNLPPEQRNALVIGARVRLYLGDFPLADGRIDRIGVTASRSSGTVYSIHGRDRLGPVVDAVADPRVQFKTGATLAEFLKAMLSPYGWVSEEHYAIDNAANRDAKTGGLRGTPTRVRKKKGTGELKSFVIHQLKPHNHEGLFRFVQRVAERHGLWIRVSADGEKIIVAPPDFNQSARYKIVRRNDGTTNVLDGEVTFDGTDQPSVIIADGFSGGGEFARGKVKSACVNPYFGFDSDGFIADDVSKVLAEYPEAEQVLFMTQPFTRRASKMPPKPMFLHDEESKTQSQLNFFVKRTMSELLRRSLVCNYTVEGHGQTVDGVFTPWDIDTIVDVQDDIGGVNERMYVLGRTLEKSRSGGTHTRLELIRLYSIAAGDQDELSEKDNLVANTGESRRRDPEVILNQTG